MRVVHLIGQLGHGGTERQLSLVLTSMDRDVQSTVVVFNPSPNRVYNDDLVGAGVEVIELGEGARSVARRALCLLRLLRERRPDIVHSWTTHDNVYAGVIGRLAGVPVLWGSSRSTLSYSLRALSRPYRILALRSVQRVVVNSTTALDELLGVGLPKTRILHLPNCVRVDASFRRDDASASVADRHRELAGMGVPSGSRVVASVGNLRQVKNHALFVEAMVSVLARHADAVGVVVGQEVAEEPDGARILQQQIDRLGLADRIILTGFRSDAPRLMRCFSVLVVASLAEGSPNVVLEAMAASCPVVATAVGGVPEIVEDGVNGRLVETGDARALADRVCELLERPEEAMRLGQAGHRTVLDRFSCAQAAGRLYAAYAEAVGES